MMILDSSVIVAMFRKDDVHHKEALKIWKTWKNFLLFDHILSESLTVLKLRENLDIASNCAEFLMKNEKITIEQISLKDIEDTVMFFIIDKNKLSFIDTLLLIQSQKRKIPLATFDKDLIKVLTR